MNITVDECLKENGSLERECVELIALIDKANLTWEASKPAMIMNIAHSLAVIADAIGERKDEPQTERSE